MSKSELPIIVGAGPAGLSAALFLARRGCAARLIEAREKPSRESRALVVNPRTLTLLEPTGVTSEMLAIGSPIHGVQFYRSGRVAGKLSFAGIHPKFPFMLALSQTVAERLLGHALDAAGVAVERGVRMVDCRNVPGGAEVLLEQPASDWRRREVVRAPWLLAADGAHSVARRQLGIEREGSSLSRDWHFVDVPLRTSLAADHAHVFFPEEGAFHFLIRVVEGKEVDGAKYPAWRILSNRPEPLSRLMQAEPAGRPVWKSSFRVSHRVDRTLNVGAVYFAGGAAHVHSPLGAREMNLGIEDAFVFAAVAAAGHHSTYDRLRRPVDRRVVRRVKRLSQIASADTKFYRFVRSAVFLAAIRTPWIRRRIAASFAGLDHKLPRRMVRAPW